MNNKIFEKIYVLSLARRQDRRRHMIKQLKHFGISDGVKFYDAIDGKYMNLSCDNKNMTPGMIGCFLSHQSILRDAIYNGYDKILVLEDDISIEESWEHIFNLGTEQAGKFNVMFIGWHFNKNNNYIQEDSNLVIPEKCFGTHGYFVNGKESIIKMYHFIQNIENQVDLQYFDKINKDKNFTAKFLFPQIVNQIGSRTDVQK